MIFLQNKHQQGNEMKSPVSLSFPDYPETPLNVLFMPHHTEVLQGNKFYVDTHLKIIVLNLKYMNDLECYTIELLASASASKNKTDWQHLTQEDHNGFCHCTEASQPS